jgi:hypothetical protein
MGSVWKRTPAFKRYANRAKCLGAGKKAYLPQPECYIGLGEDQFLPTISRVPRWCFYTLLVLLGLAAFVSLGADFHHYTRWIDDSSRYCDDGWYAGGAINKILTGRWLHTGDFNAMVPVPGWSSLLGFVFHFTGVSVVAARAVALCFSIATVMLAGAILRRDHPRLALPFMVLMASAPLFYFFSRCALIEPSLIFLITATIWAASTSDCGGVLRLLLCGMLFTAAMIDKSNAIFAGPAIVYLIWFPCRADWRRALRMVAIPLAVFVVLEAVYLLLWVRPHEADFRLYASMNLPYLDLRSFEKFIRVFYRGITWIDPLLFPAVLVTFAVSFKRFRFLWADPLFGSSFLFFWAWVAFLVLHVDAGPHYFMVMVFPIMLMLLLLLEGLEARQPRAGTAMGGFLLLAVILNLGLIVKYMLHPQYTQRDAFLQIERQIDTDPSATRLVIGHGAKELSFYTGVLALDDMGTMSVADKLRLDHPGWVVTYSDDLSIPEDTELTQNYRFIEVGSYSVLDQIHRSHVLLYRIEKR